jgi:hypothetical protein
MTDDLNSDGENYALDSLSDRQFSDANPLERADMSDMIASHLREMSEHAMHAGLDNSSCLIEAAALVVEMEGRKSRHG